MSATADKILTAPGDRAPGAALQSVTLDVVAGWQKVADEHPPLAEAAKYRNPSYFVCSGRSVVVTAYRDGSVIVRIGTIYAPSQGFISDALSLDALGLTYQSLVEALTRKSLNSSLIQCGKLRRDQDGKHYLVAGVYNRKTKTFVDIDTVLPLRPAPMDDALSAVLLSMRAASKRSGGPLALHVDPRIAAMLAE
jgi:hypothetical protein